MTERVPNKANQHLVMPKAVVNLTTLLQSIKSKNDEMECTVELKRKRRASDVEPTLISHDTVFWVGIFYSWRQVLLSNRPASRRESHMLELLQFGPFYSSSRVKGAGGPNSFTINLSS